MMYTKKCVIFGIRGRLSGTGRVTYEEFLLNVHIIHVNTAKTSRVMWKCPEFQRHKNTLLKTFKNSRKYSQNQPGDVEMPWISATLEECLEALSILLNNQAAKPKRHL